jgi:hypothetical protein
MSLNGPIRDWIIISGEEAFRVLYIQAGTVNINNLTLANGLAPNGAGLIVEAAATVQLRDCRIVGNIATPMTSGGGINNAGNLTIIRCSIEHNAADAGGGIASSGNLTIEDSQILGNRASSSYGGGILLGNSSATIRRTDIKANSAVSSGGGISVTNSELQIDDSVISENRAEGSGGLGGGALLISTNVDVFINHSLVSNNESSGGSYRGAIYNAGNLALEWSTISDTVGLLAHGILQSGTLDVLNSTISGNAGYGIYNTGSSGSGTRIRNSTIAFNQAGGVHGADWGLELYANIIANNGGYDCFNIVLASFVDSGWNIDSDDSCQLTMPSDQAGVDPRLGPLVDPFRDSEGYSIGAPGNKIVLPAHPLFALSPAIDTGDNGNCPALDQLGSSRPIDGDEDGMATCDIGAVEQAPQPYLVINDELAPVDDRLIPFGNVDVGGGRGGGREVAFTLINQGMQELVISRITLNNTPVFSLNLSGGTNPCVVNLSVVLAPGESCTLAAVFTPVSGGLQSDNMQVNSNDPQEPVITVNLSGTGKTPPQLSSGTGSFDIAENAANGTVVTTLTSTDADGDEPSYSIESGNEAGHFTIDTSTGVISVAATLDYETTRAYTLSIMVDDGNGESDTGEVIVNITDVDEPQGGGGGGGCTLHRGAPFDPLLPLLLLMAVLYMVKGKVSWVNPIRKVSHAP